MLLIVRHGRTATNAAGRLLGRADPPLDDVGRTQVAALAAAIDRSAVTRVVCSPLARARETAAALDLDCTVDERWIELDYGEYDDRAFADVPPDVWDQWRTDVDFAPPGGESLRQLGARVRAACDDLLEEASRADVVVVSHVSPIKAAVGWALGVGDEVAWRLYVAPASITRIHVHDGRAVLHSFNERTW